jgi:predicted CopG family antitoxin
MQKKLTVTIDEEVYEGLREVIGPRKISRFIEDLVRPHNGGRCLLFRLFATLLSTLYVCQLKFYLCRYSD